MVDNDLFRVLNFGGVSVTIVAEGKVPANLYEDLLSLQLIDEIGLKSDELTLKIVGGYLRPKGGDRITLLIDGTPYGTFSVTQTIRTQSDIEIKATASNFSESLKERKNRGWDKIRLCNLVERIAKEHNLKYKCNAKVIIDHAAQHYESDLSFMSRLAKTHNLRFSIKNDTILMLTYEEKESADMPMFYVDISECKSYSIKHDTRPAYKSCKAQYHDTRANETKSVVVGKGEPQLVLQGSFKDKKTAYERANAALLNISQGSITGNIIIYGQEIRAGGLLYITNALDDTGVYTINKVTHTIDPSSGYLVKVEFTK